MGRDDDNKALDKVRSPEDADAKKVAVSYVFNPNTSEFYPDSKDLYSSEPQVHRENVTSVDTVDPPESYGIDCRGYKRCRFDVDVGGDGISSLKVITLRWNSRVDKWFPSGVSVDLHNAETFGVSGGKASLIEDEAFGATIFLKVSEFVGNSFTMNVYYILC